MLNFFGDSPALCRHFIAISLFSSPKPAHNGGRNLQVRENFS